MDCHSWDSPKCLVENSDTGGLQVNKETKNLLEKAVVPVDVVAIVGLYRTGKTYLMNRLAGRSTGFDIGSTIQAKTKGIWAWLRPHPVQTGMCRLLLDSEGLGDPEKGDKNHDVWTFVLAVLLSNTLIYNSQGTIDQDAIDKLRFVSDISEYVKVKTRSNDDENEFDNYFPKFIWAVRDFQLELELDGRPCTADEYMENALVIKKGVSRTVSDCNLPRQSLKRHFPTRKCFVFPQPLEDMKDIPKLDSLPTSDLTKDFLAATKTILEYLEANSHPKFIRGAAVTGRGLAILADTYVKAIQDGAIPCIENAVDAMARAHNSKAAEDALDYYRTKIRNISFPTETLELLSEHHRKCEEKAFDLFSTTSIFDNEKKYREKMAETINHEYQKVQRENQEASDAKCQIILEQLYAPIDEKVKMGAYFRAGGYTFYKEDMDKLKKDYKLTLHKGVKDAEKLQNFIDSQASLKEGIKNMEDKLNEGSKEWAEQKSKADKAEMEKAKAQDLAMKTMANIEEMIKSQQKTLEQLSKKLEKEQKSKADKAMVKQVEGKIEEMEKSFKEQDGVRMKEIEELKSRLEEIEKERLEEIEKKRLEEIEKKRAKNGKYGLSQLGLSKMLSGKL